MTIASSYTSTRAQIAVLPTVLIYGLAHLMMLAFGVVLGVELSGNVPLQEPSPPIGSLAVAMAVVAMAVGFYLFLSAPAGSLIWLVIAIGVAIVGQWLGGFVLSRPLAGSVGAFAVVPVAMISSTFTTAPSAVVMILAAFWGLVPGAFSFIRVSEAATGAAAGFALGASSSRRFCRSRSARCSVGPCSAHSPRVCTALGGRPGRRFSARPSARPTPSRLSPRAAPAPRRRGTIGRRDCRADSPAP